MLKNQAELIRAFSNQFKNKKYRLNIVGQGTEFKLQYLIDDLEVMSKFIY